MIKYDTIIFFRLFVIGTYQTAFLDSQPTNNQKQSKTYHKPELYW